MKKRPFFLFLIFFWLFWITGGINPAQAQVKAYVTVTDTSLASGETYQLVTVLLQNDVPVRGIELMFTLGRPVETDFTTDLIKIDVDSNTVPPETTVVRYCKIQTAGTLVEDFEWIKAHGEVGNTAFLDCDWVKVAGMAYDGDPIPPGSGVLLKLYVDVLCIPDTTQDRTAHIVLNGFISDPDAQLVETQFNFGTLYLDHTWCGDVQECVCGDVESSGHVSIVDVVHMINWLFNNGTDLCPEMMGDVNKAKGVSIADVVYLINHLFNDGEDPVCIRKY
ncbi:MAG: hypothetical protein WBD28_03035 [Candidatus Zixiibacteriota bacterium]